MQVAILLAEVSSTALIGFAVFRTDPVQGFPFPGGLLSVLGTLSLIAVGAHAPTELSFGCTSVVLPLSSRLLSLPNLVYIGRLSYPLYLWHWPIIVIVKFTVGPRAFEDSAAMASTIVLSLLAAALTYHCVEAPFRGRWRATTPRQTIAIFLPAVCCVVIFMLLLRGPLVGRLYALSPVPFSPTVPGFSPLSSMLKTHHSPPHCACRMCTPTWHVPPAVSIAPGKGCCFLGRSNATAINEQWDCFPSTVFGVAPTKVESTVRRCLRPIRRWPSQPAIFLVGDSHAFDKLKAIERAVGHSGKVVFVGTLLGCGYSSHSFHTDMIRMQWWNPPSATKDCDNFNRYINDALRDQLRPGDIVAVATSFTRYSLLTTHSLLLTCRGDILLQVLTTHYSLLTTNYLLAVATFLQVLTAHYSLLTTYYLIAVETSFSGYSLLTTHHLLLLAVAASFTRYQSLKLKHGSELALEVAKQAVRQERYLEALRSNITSPRGAKLLIIGDQPRMPVWTRFDATDARSTCLPTRLSLGGVSACGVERVKSLRETMPVREATNRLAMARDVFTFDTHDLFCGPAGVCGPFIPGTAVLAYGDDNHLSSDGTQYSAPFWCKFFYTSGLLQEHA